jgi:hypothetical protein
VNAECCDELTEHCSSGIPSTCNQGCSEVFLPFWALCAGHYGHLAPAFEGIVARCQATAHACADRPARANQGAELVPACQNGGTCSAPEMCVGTDCSTFACACVAGYTGRTCATRRGSLTQDCRIAYTEVYMSAFTGACAGRVCTTACQTMINNMVNKCQGQTFTIRDPADDPESDTEVPFSHRAAAVLAPISPTDCDYSI